MAFHVPEQKERPLSPPPPPLLILFSPATHISLPLQSHLSKAACCLCSLGSCYFGQNASPIQFCLVGLSGTALYPYASLAVTRVWVFFGPSSTQLLEGVGYA